MSTHSPAKSGSAFASPEMIGRAIRDAFVKLNPAALMRNPVIFVTEVVAALVTVLFVRDFLVGNPLGFTGQIMAWLWFTVLFANFAEAIAEGRGRAQADSLRKARTDTVARRLREPHRRTSIERVSALDLKVGDHVLVEAGDLIP
ncbi:MAG: potassium-transporting ATPase subunit B, partial [Ancylobacter novellus]